MARLTRHSPADAFARDRRVVVSASFTGFLCYFAMLPAVPAIMARSHPSVAAGATVALMAGAVVTQAAVPWLVARVPRVRLFAAGTLLVGTPSPLYALSDGVAFGMGVTVARGVGFGLLAALGTALVIDYTTEARRGMQLGAYGLATSLAAVLGPPISLWLVSTHRDTVLYGGVFAAAAAGASIMLCRRPRDAAGHPEPTPAAVRDRHAAVAVLLFLPFACAYGATYTLLPVWLSGRSAAPLLAFALAFAVLRLVGGGLVDVVGPSPVLISVAVLGPAGAALVAVPGGIVTVTIGAGVGGAACGLAAILTLLLGVARLPPGRHTAIAAAWNLVFDLGIGVGSLVWAMMVTVAGYRSTFAAIGVTLGLVGVMFVRWGLRHQDDRVRP